MPVARTLASHLHACGGRPRRARYPRADTDAPELSIAAGGHYPALCSVHSVPASDGPAWRLSAPHSSSPLTVLVARDLPHGHEHADAPGGHRMAGLLAANSTLHLGWIGLSEFIPMFVLAIPAGNLADRCPAPDVGLALFLGAAIGVGLAVIAILGDVPGAVWRWRPGRTARRPFALRPREPAAGPVPPALLASARPCAPSPPRRRWYSARHCAACSTVSRRCSCTAPPRPSACWLGSRRHNRRPARGRACGPVARGARPAQRARRAEIRPAHPDPPGRDPA